MISGLGILVVEDDADILRMVATILEAAGAIVTCTQTGRQAIEIVRADDFDAIIVDWNLSDMPSGQSLGPLADAKPQLKARTLVITGELMLSPEEHAAGSAGYSILAKPFRPAELRDAVTRLVA